MKKKKLQTDLVSFRIPKPIAKRLERMSNFTGLSQSAIMRAAVERELWRIEKRQLRLIEVEKDFQAVIAGTEYADMEI